MLIVEKLDYLQCDALDQRGDCPLLPGIPLRGTWTRWSVTRQDPSVAKD